MLLAVFALAPTAVLAQQARRQIGSSAGTAKTQQQGRNAEAKTEAARNETEEAQAKTEEDAKLISVPGGKALGMSILGNQEAPKALVIVPWKSSELGNAPGISTMLDDSRLPIDKEVFMRMLSYYEIRSETARPSGAPTKRMRRSPQLRRRGGSNDFHGTVRKRRFIRRRGDGLPRPAFPLFGGDDRRQAPPLPLGLAPVGDVQARVQEVPPRRRRSRI